MLRQSRHAHIIFAPIVLVLRWCVDVSKNLLARFRVAGVLFFASILIFPLFVWGLSSVLGTKDVGGATGAFALVISMALKPLLFLIFIFSLISICRSRAKDAGFHPAIGLLIPIFFVADWPFGVFLATTWSFGFSSGMARVSSIPMYSTAAIVSALLLASAPSRPSASSVFDKWQWAVFMVLSLLTAVLAVLVAVSSLPGTGLEIERAIGRGVLSIASQISPWILAAFMGAAVLIGLKLRQDRPSSVPTLNGSPDLDLGGLALPRTHRFFILGIGVAITLLVTVFNDMAGPDATSLPINMITQPVQSLLPTFAIYSFVVWAFWRVVIFRTPLAAVLFLGSLVPFGFWFYALVDDDRFRVQEAQELSEIKLAQIGKIPDVLVYDGEYMLDYRKLLCVTGVSQLIETDGGSETFRIEFPRFGIKRVPVDKLPEAYLHLIVGQKSSFAGERSYFGSGGPFELRNVGSGKNDLIGVWYEQTGFRPATPPILLGLEWAPQRSGSTNSEQLSDAMLQFLQRVIPEQERMRSVELSSNVFEQGANGNDSRVSSAASRLPLSSLCDD